MKKNFFLSGIIFFLITSCSDEPKDLTGRPSRGGDTVEITDAGAQSSAGGHGAEEVKKAGTTFQDYPVEIYTGKIAPPDFSSNPGKRLYRTVIGKGLKKGVNFAGKYVIASWKCGDDCQESAIIDAETGKIFNGISTNSGLQFQQNSRLLIANPGSPQQELYVWENESLRKISS